MYVSTRLDDKYDGVRFSPLLPCSKVIPEKTFLSKRTSLAFFDLQSLLSVSASRGAVFRRYPLNGRIDQIESWAQGVPACDLICWLHTLITKNGFLRLARNVQHGAGSVQTIQFLRKCYGCRDPFTSPTHLT